MPLVSSKFCSFSQHARSLTLSLVLCPCVGVSLAQSNPNTDNWIRPFGPNDASSIDSVDVGTGALTIDIPLLSFPQRGNLPPLVFKIHYASKQFGINDHCITPPDGADPYCEPKWQQNTRFAYPSPFSPGVVFDDGTAIAVNTMLQKNNSGNIYSFAAVTPDGSQHALYYSPFTSGQISGDGTGFMCSGCIYNNLGATHTTYTPQGLHGSSAYEAEDPQGNVYTKNGSNDVDSVGRSFPAGTNTTDFSGCATISNYPIAYAQVATIPGYGGTTTQIKGCYSGLVIVTAFNDSTYVDSMGNQSPWQSGATVTEMNAGFNVLQSVVLYNGTSWSTSPTWVFHYNNDQSSGTNYGDLTEIDLPTGGKIQYSYSNAEFFDDTLTGYMGVVNMSRVVASRTVDAEDGSPAVTKTYGRGGTTGSMNDGANDTVYTFGYFGISPYPTEVDYYSGSGSGRTLLKKVNTTYTYSSDPYSVLYNNAVPSVLNVLPISITTTLPNGLQSQVTKTYQSGTGTFQSYHYTISTGQVTQETESDWGSGAPGPIIRCTATTYKTQQNSAYFNVNLLTIPAVVSVYSGACGTGTLMAQTTYGYDESGLTTSGVTEQRDPNAPSLTTRGNLTSVHRWLNTTGSTLNESYKYYDTGEKYQYTDAKGNPPTTYSYSNSYYGAYLTQTQMPATGGVSHIVSAGYDLNSGLMTSFVNQNNQTSTYSYDSLFRMTSASFPDTGYINLSYPSFTQVQKTVGVSSSQSILTTYNFDGLGRPVNTTLSEGNNSYIYTRTAYNAQGLKYEVWNPSRCDQRFYSSCSGETTWGVTQYQYDGLGRQTLLIPPDGTATTNNESTVYASNTTTFTDEYLNQWSRTTDGLGRLIKVLEPNGTTSTPTLETDYVYDALGNLTCVQQQGGVSGTGCSSSPSNDATSPWRVRRFTYDSLSRLLTAKNPETGTITYAYSLSGGVLCAGDQSLPCSKTDARNVAITYAYDALNRITGKTYSDSEPAISYTYDASGANNYGVGLRTGMADSSGSTTWTFDKMGRTWSEARTIGTVQKTISNQYYLNGALWKLTYPSGAVLEYTLDNAGRNLALKDDTNVIQYVQNATYAPQGALGSAVLGYTTSFAGITETNQFNSRLQSSLISAASPSGTLLNLSYGYYNASNENNGNVVGITNNKDTTRNQSFKYDTLNRVSQAQAGTRWGATFTYDPWGNLYQTGTVAGTSILAMNVNQQISGANQFTQNGYLYDAAGNVIKDGSLVSACSGYVYTWNAEEQAICSYGSTYVYNGDGSRIKKSGGSATPLMYWGGEAGDSLAESDTSGNLTSEYVFFNSRRIARRDSSGGKVYYYFSDHLGSSNVITNATGSIPPLDESDYYPFGGEAVISSSLSNHYKFTGKERDTESGNDYFGARYYASTMGRFLSPDWSAQEEPVPYAKLDDPQTLNLYAYVGNNPLTRVDADGHVAGVDDAAEAGAAVVTLAVVGAIALEAGAVAYNNSPEGQRSWSTFSSAVSDSFSSNVNSIKNTVTGWFSKKSAPAPAASDGKTNTGPKAATAAGVSAGGQATDEHGNKLGPSGKPQVNKTKSSTRKGAQDKALSEGSGTVEHSNPTVGKPHFHPTGADGDKKPSSTHHEYPN